MEPQQTSSLPKIVARRFHDGSSQSAAFVAGAAALLYSAYIDAGGLPTSSQQIINFIPATAFQIFNVCMLICDMEQMLKLCKPGHHHRSEDYENHRMSQKWFLHVVRIRSGKIQGLQS